jgi:hypothetical protein
METGPSKEVKGTNKVELMHIYDGHYMVIAGNDKIFTYLGVGIFYKDQLPTLQYYASFFDKTDDGWLTTQHDSFPKIVERAIDAKNPDSAKWIAVEAARLQPETAAENSALLIGQNYFKSVFFEGTPEEGVNIKVNVDHAKYEEERDFLEKNFGIRYVGTTLMFPEGNISGLFYEPQKHQSQIAVYPF